MMSKWSIAKLWLVAGTAMAAEWAGLGTAKVRGAEQKTAFAAPSGTAGEAVRLLATLQESDLLKAGESAHDPGKAQQLRELCQQVIELVAPESPLGQELTRVGSASDGTPREPAEMVRVLQEAARSVSFVPKSEAELPTGFPTYTPPGIIEVKSYPSRRLAKADGFWTLFQHITTNDIAMTTPVQMDFVPDDEGRLRQQSMAFYYGSQEIGEAGTQGSVVVADDRPQETVSLGVRGRATRTVIADGVERLEAWLANHPEYVADGPVRVMGYNSPMVPAARQFHEIQLPIRAAAGQQP